MKRKHYIIIATVVALCLLVSVGAFVYFKWLAPRLSLTLNGGDASVEVFSEYRDDGAQAQYGSILWGQKEIGVTESGQVDPSRLGEYVLEYRCDYRSFSQIKYRRVRVVDTTPPTIDCPEELTCYVGKPVPLTYTATDNYDGDLTDAVVREDGDGVITLHVADSSGNTTERKVTLHVITDNEPPVITLTGDAECFVRQGTEFTDPGAVATDNVDGAVTVAVTGTVDTAATGTYTLTYTAADGAGNTASVTRSVTVYPHLTVSTSTVPLNGATVYLTFDDGPGRYTAQLLDILAEYEAKATFFVTAQFQGYLDMIGRAHNEGHAIGVHTLTHDFSIYSSATDYFADLGAMEEIVREQIGTYTDIIRFPGGSSNLVSRQYCDGIMSRLVDMVEEQGYSYFDWNVGSNDTGTTDPDIIYHNVISGIEGKSAAVVLMHDIKPATVEAIPRILDWCLENGYTLAPLTSDSPNVHHGVQN